MNDPNTARSYQLILVNLKKMICPASSIPWGLYLGDTCCDASGKARLTASRIRLKADWIVQG